MPSLKEGGGVWWAHLPRPPWRSPRGCPCTPRAPAHTAVSPRASWALRASSLPPFLRTPGGEGGCGMGLVLLGLSRSFPGTVRARVAPWPQASLVPGTTHTHGRRGHSDSAAHSCAALATCISVSLPRPSPVAVPRLQNRDHATPGARWEGGMAHVRPVPGTWNALSTGRPHDHFSVSCRAVPPMSPAGSTHWGFSLVETSGRASSNLVCPGLWLSCSLTPHRPLPPE